MLNYIGKCKFMQKMLNDLVGDILSLEIGDHFFFCCNSYRFFIKNNHKTTTIHEVLY